MVQSVIGADLLKRSCKNWWDQYLVEFPKKGLLRYTYLDVKIPKDCLSIKDNFMKVVRVFLLKDIEKIGIAGEIIKTAEGFARNFLIPKKLGVEVTPANESSFSHRVKTIEHRKEVVESKTSMLAEKIKGIELVIKRKIHDGEQLYGSISSREIAEELAKQGIAVSNSQVIMDKAIKTKGAHVIVIKLSSKLQPTLKVKIVSDLTA